MNNASNKVRLNSTNLLLYKNQLLLFWHSIPVYCLINICACDILEGKKQPRQLKPYRYFYNKETRYTYICQDTSSQYNEGTLKSQNNWFNLYTWSILGWKCSVGPNLFNNFFTNFIIILIHGRSSCGRDRHWRSSDQHSPPTPFSQASVPTKKPRRLTSISQGSPAGGWSADMPPANVVRNLLKTGASGLVLIFY